MKPSKWNDTPEQAFKRVAQILRNYRGHTELVTKAIAECHARELWKVKYFSFREFCEKECGYSSNWVYELKATYETILEITNVKDSDSELVRSVNHASPANQSLVQNMTVRQRKALDGLPPVKKAEVFHGAINAEGGKSPTPKTINGVRHALVKEEPEVLKDKTGCPVPEGILEDWKRATEQGMGWIRRLDAIKHEFLEHFGVDFALADVNKSTWESDFSNFRYHFKHTIPYAVCGTCQGKIPKYCKTCHGRGWLNQMFWERCVPIEIKAIRSKVYGTKSSATLSA